MFDGLALGLFGTLKARRQGEGIEQDLQHRGVLLDCGRRGRAAGRRTSGKAALDAPHPALHARNDPAQPRLGRLLAEIDSQFEGDRIEAAGVDDPCAGGLGRRIVLADDLVHPVWLACQIQAVGSGFHAGRHQTVAIELIGPNRGDDRLGAADHGLETGRIVGVGHDQRRFRRQRQQVANLFELGLGPSRHGPGHLPAHAVPLAEILGDQAARIAGGAIDDEVEFGVGVHRPGTPS